LSINFSNMSLTKFAAALLLVLTISSCSDKKNYPKAENALDAGREFIDACLKGDFDKASFYMLNDTRNNDILLKQKKSYSEKSDAEKKEYSNASITIFEDAVINDSTHIINFQNSYDKFGRKVKVILHDDSWLVDFKYTFDGNL
jgi:hypothetical protein